MTWIMGIVAQIGVWFGGSAIQKIVKCIPAIVAEIEKAMADGKIDAGERKAIAMSTIDALAKEFGIPVNGLIRWAISFIIDQVAKKLPSKDIVIPATVSTLIAKVIK